VWERVHFDRIPVSTLSRSDARRIVLHAQGLDGRWRPRRGKEGAAEIVERLGYVQIDTIAVIERAHHHVLWTRHPGYRPNMLRELLGRDRRVIEQWTHAAAYVPTADYRFYVPGMRRYAERPKVRSWLEENRAVVARVRERIQTEGPLGSADFADPRGKRGPWWDWKPAKRALEILFRSGELMITARRNFHRLYDLAERVLPAEIGTSPPPPDELARFVVRRYLSSQGVATAKNAGWWLRDRTRVAAALEELVDNGEVLPVNIEGVEDGSAFCWTAALEEAPRRSSRRKPLHLLSPFDNLVIDRQRTERLFGFDYRLECYTPAAQRRYGYFTLPILWGDRFVGRLDPKADRKVRRLLVRNLVLEPDLGAPDAFYAALAEKLREFALFNGCEQIAVEPNVVDPPGALLRAALATAHP
jgi:uncharacterized protein YcaQ